MRRQIIVLFVALFLAGSVWAGYPDEYFGPPIPEGCMEIEAYVPDGWYLDRNPWSSPSPEEKFFWFGELCVKDGVAELEFTHLASRHCKEHPAGIIGDPKQCYAWSWIQIREPDRHLMPWDPDFDEDWGFYITSIFRGNWEWFYESLSAAPDGESFVFIEGVFEYVQPLWYVESDNYTRWKFLVSPRSTPVFGTRKVSRRVGG